MKPQIVLVDIDGCLLPKGNLGGNLSVLEKIRHYNRMSRLDPAIPAITLCSGRPAPYVEALVKLIEGFIPAIFEWGAGIYYPVNYDFQYSALFTSEVRAVRQKVLDITTTAIRNGSIKAKIQPGKEVAITLYPQQGITTDNLYKTLEQHWSCIKEIDLYEIQVTQNRIDLLPFGIKKDVGVFALANILKLDIKNILGIGDDESDLSFLDCVGVTGCPANARSEVKNAVDYVSPFEHGQGVIDILEHFLN